MITGSSVANTVSSGSFTIPMMKRAKLDLSLLQLQRHLLPQEDKLCPLLWVLLHSL
ncbi:TRAP transporter large permease subunit [Pseudomonas sp. 2822-17]|uniref:TRAP transporter large permease subunit n=1 Tax=Pseudomonas sp. 2822-17 TaxID=1712678 RepID=UPI0021154B61|nr:TRAP transporter large permease subunit [Pseudomonas sp. 2822-17]